MKSTMSIAALVMSVALLGGCDGGEEKIAGQPPSGDATDPSTPTGEGPAGTPRDDGRASETPRVSSPARAPVAPSTPGIPDLVTTHPPEVLACDRALHPRALGVTGARMYWQLDCSTTSGDDYQIVAAAPAGGGAATVITTWRQNLFTKVDAHAVLRRERHFPVEKYVTVIPAGSTTELTLPESHDCLATASDAAHVYCLTAPQYAASTTGTESTSTSSTSLKAWTVAGAGPTIIATLGGDATHLASDGVTLYVGHSGSTWPQASKQRTRYKRDGQIVAVDPATGALRVVQEGVATTSLLARKGTVAWTDWLADVAENIIEPQRSMLAPATAPVLDTTKALFDESAGSFKVHALDADGTSILLWTLATQPANDVVLAPNARIHHFVHPAANAIGAFTVDATHVYWITTQGVFRRAK